MEYITYKKCSNKKCENPNTNKLGLLDILYFSKNKSSKDGLQHHCKYCVNKHRNENQNYHKQYRQSENYRERRKTYDKKYTKTVIGRFRTTAIKANGKHFDSKINYKQLVCLFVSSNGICPITNMRLNFKNMHLDHLKSLYVGGNNDYDNLVFIKHVANMGKNGFGLKKYMHEMGFEKEKQTKILKSISDIHNRYEFTINQFLEMTDEQLELTVKAIMNPT